MAGQLGFDGGAIPDEQEAYLEVARRDKRAIDDDGRPGIAAHGVDRYAHKPAVSYELSAISPKGESRELKAESYSSTALTCRPA
jgi:hypothetical protein